MDINFLFLGLFLSLSFFCSMSETSFFSLSNLKIEDIKKKHPRRGSLIASLVDSPQKLLVTILICNTFANIFATLTASKIFATYFPTMNLWVLILTMTFMVLIFGEVTPKSLAIKIAPITSVLVAPVWFILEIVLTPFIFIFRQFVKVLVAIVSELFYPNIKESDSYKTDEVIEVIKESQKHGIIDKEEGAILGNVIEFANTEIWELMRPRNEIFSLSSDTIISEAIEKIKERKYSRIPVWEDEEENIIGILYVKDLLMINGTKRKLSYYKTILRKPFFVPESVKAEKLLRDFKTTNNHLAIVIDEYGGVAGLITMEDVLEAIIGEVIDKDDVRPLYYKYNTSMIEVEGKLDIDEFNKVFKTAIRSSEATTIAGFLLEKIKKIPNVGEIFLLDNLQFKISGALPNKIEKILITKIRKIKEKKIL
ncbi:MAG: hypothetical protein A2086_10965 [Spirochaetes bacterium GWD1_27_9]|nr:MAG: hypothetical protein A2Z98_00065 [Spirochaetes bacterium GWB1_27_13]OHD20180.1 MAG: hypothetical protein A2Y34_05085 [Spirochaetes bacterium GWC1_27_15]OHD41272.1 MAG: hypothetical protein A2086_10965 [Spirochaetes bacterium GWD1_27_9]